MKNISEKLGKFWYVKVGILAIVLILPVLIRGLDSGNYFTLLGCFILVYMIAASGLDILFGYCGQISLGHAGFFAIGAYGSALLNNYTGVSPFFTAIIASLIAALVAVVISYPAASLKFHFLSLATQAFGEIIYSLVSASPGGITGNFVGMFPKHMSVFGLELDSNFKFYYFLVILVLLGLVVKSNLIKSKTGRGFIAIRENVTAAGGMGVNVRKYKIIAFCTSAFYVAFAGALYGHLVGYISPGTFTFDQSVIFLTMVLFGGSGTLFGPVVGAAVVQIINELLRNFEKYQTLFYGIFLLVVILFMPNGIVKLRIFTGKKKIKKETKEVSDNAKN